MRHWDIKQQGGYSWLRLAPKGFPCIFSPWEGGTRNSPMENELKTDRQLPEVTMAKQKQEQSTEDTVEEVVQMPEKVPYDIPAKPYPKTPEEEWA